MAKKIKICEDGSCSLAFNEFEQIVLDERKATTWLTEGINQGILQPEEAIRILLDWRRDRKLG